MVVVEGGKGEAPGGRGGAHAQRGPVRRCMADLETRSPQGETRGPKRRPRKIATAILRESLFLSIVLLPLRCSSFSRGVRV